MYTVVFDTYTHVHLYPRSSQQTSRSKKKSSTSRKHRQNQNEEIRELVSLVPLFSSQAGSLVPSNRGKPQTVSVLRLTTTFLKLQNFMKDGEIKRSIHTHWVLSPI